MTVSDPKSAAIVLSVDAMGGDQGPAPVVAGLARFLNANPDAHVLLHGREDDLKRLIQKRKITSGVTIVHANDVVAMTDKPSQVDAPWQVHIHVVRHRCRARQRRGRMCLLR